MWMSLSRAIAQPIQLGRKIGPAHRRVRSYTQDAPANPSNGRKTSSKHGRILKNDHAMTEPASTAPEEAKAAPQHSLPTKPLIAPPIPKREKNGSDHPQAQTVERRFAEVQPTAEPEIAWPKHRIEERDKKCSASAISRHEPEMQLAFGNAAIHDHAPSNQTLDGIDS